MRIRLEEALDDLSPEQRRRLVERRPPDEPRTRERVREIIRRVREEGDIVLRELARTYDGVELDGLEVPRSAWDDALDALDPALRASLERARANIEAFHRAQLPDPLEMETEPGVRVGRVTVPLPAVGVYAPGGRASYPSSVLMGVVPAVAAGVERVVVCSPPGPGGVPPGEVLAASALAGAHRVYALGGAGAVAALAYGTPTVPRVSAVVGPGNRWVTEAKRQVAGDVRTDAPAGPSEVLVVATPEGAPTRGAPLPELIARELVAQAEHDPDAAAVAVSPSGELLQEVRAALEGQVAGAPRREIVEAALEARGALLRARDLEEALAFADDYAPEHLALYTSSPRADMVRVRSAGSVFLGASSSVAFGDYLAGPSHVLPTGGLARSFSGLSAWDFLRSFTWQQATSEGAQAMGEAVARLAAAEGLPGHAAAALARRSSP